MQEKIWKIQASYTVEASYIMSMVILSLAVLIRAAYGQYLDKTSLFLMNYAVERLYGQEENKSEALQYGSVSGNAVRTKTQVTGTICGQDHMRSIKSKNKRLKQRNRIPKPNSREKHKSTKLNRRCNSNSTKRRKDRKRICYILNKRQ